MVRAASAKDVPAIAGMIRELAEFEKLLDKCEVTEESLHRHLFGEKRAAEALVMEVEGKAVGYAIYFLTFSTFLGRPGIYLEDIYVQPAHRGQGIGTSVFRHLARVCLDRGYGRLEWSVLDWNTKAKAFYEGMGAKQLEEWEMMRMTEEAMRGVAGREV
jgi:GNAT superfamily N-acetyltransferase